jgi:hypothetical protein
MGKTANEERHIRTEIQAKYYYDDQIKKNKRGCGPHGKDEKAIQIFYAKI